MNKSKLAISVDVEDWYHSRHVTSSHPEANTEVMSFKKRYDREYKYLHDPIMTLLDLYDELSVKATFFIVADLIEDNFQTLEQIVAGGHEIGCHGLHHIEYVGEGCDHERKLFEDNVSSSKKMLEQLSGKKVLGFRAPSAFYRSWMTPLLTDLGFVYDSSISRNSLFNKFEGPIPTHIKSNPTFLDLSDNSQGSIVEIPWPYLNVFGFKVPTGGGPTIRYFPKAVNTLGIKQSLRRGDTSFYIHPHDISDKPLPDVIASSRGKFWRNRGSVALTRYRDILNAFRGRTATCGEVFERYVDVAVKSNAAP